MSDSNPTHDFVSGSSHESHTRVKIWDKPLDWETYLKLHALRAISVPQHETLRAEIEAQPEPEMKRKRRAISHAVKSVPGSPHKPFRVENRPWTEYEPAEIVAYAAQVRARYETVLNAFLALEKPNAKNRRSMRRFTERFQHELNALPFKYVTHVSRAQGSMPKKWAKPAQNVPLSWHESGTELATILKWIKHDVNEIRICLGEPLDEEHLRMTRRRVELILKQC